MSEQQKHPVRTTGNAPESAATIDLVELMYKLLESWKVIVCFALAFAILVGAYTLFFVTPMYQATSTIYVIGRSDSVINMADLQIGTALTDDYQKVFKMWEVHEAVISNLNLPYDYKELRDMLTVSNDPGTRMLDITVTSAVPEEAMNIANEYARVASQYLVVAFFLWVAYKRNQGEKLTCSWQRAKCLLNKSYHFILSGMMIAIYGGTDRLMLKHMMNEAEVGYYSTALSICNMWVFLLVAIIDSLKPVIMQQYTTDKLQFEKRNRQLYAIVFYASVVVSMGFVLLGNVIVGVLYGKAYLPAAAPLKIITWYMAFSYLGVAREAWVVCENRQRYLKYLYAGAALTNVVLNLLLIPKWGASGAASASLITQISTIFIFPVFIRETRPNVKLMLDAIILRDIR